MLKPSPRQLKLALNFFPPYVGSGIRMRYIADDGSRVVTTHRPRRINANLVGTAFGGTIQTMTDGFYLFMGMTRLGGGLQRVGCRIPRDLPQTGQGTHHGGHAHR